MKLKIQVLVLACSFTALRPLGAQTNMISIFPNGGSSSSSNFVLVWPTTPGLTYEVLQSTNLQSWSVMPGFPTVANGPVQQMPLLTTGAAGFFQLAQLDEQPPAIASQFPQDGGFAVSRFSDITAQLSDATGIDTNSIQLTISGLGTFTLASPQLTFSNGVLTFLNNGTPLGNYGTNVEVTLVAADILGNVGTNTWSFTLEVQPQVATNLFVFGSSQAQVMGQRVGNIPTAALAKRLGPVPQGTSGNPWTLESVQSNSLVISYTNTPPNFTTNTYVCNLTPATTNDIFYREIVAVSNDPVNMLLTLFTTNVPLAQIIPEGSASLSSSSMIYNVGTNGAFLSQALIAGTLTLPTLGADFSGRTIYDANGVSLTLNQGYWEFTPSLQIEFETHLFSLQRFQAEFVGDMNAALVPELTFTGALQNSVTNDLFSKDYIIYLGQIGLVPVWVDLGFDLQAQLGYNVSASARISSGIKQDLSITLGAQYDISNSPSVSPIFKLNVPQPDIVPFTYTINGSANAYVALVPEVSARVESVAGVEADVNPKVSIGGQATYSNGQLSSASFGITADAYLNLGLSVVGIPDSELPTLGSQQLFSWSWSTNYPSPTQLTILTQPQSQNVLAGSSVSFSVDAAAGQPIGYQWYFNGIPLPGQTSPTLLLTDATYGDGGNYSASLTAGGETISSAAATLTVSPPGAPFGSNLESGLTIDGNIAVAGQVDRYALNLTNGEPYYLVLTVTEENSIYFDPRIDLFGPGGKDITYSGADSHGVAVIAGHATASGTFYVTVRDSSNKYTGGYSLTLTKVLGPQAPDSSGDEGQLISGATVNGTIRPLGDIDLYTLNLTNGEPYYLVLTVTEADSIYFDPIIYLFGPNGGSVTYSVADSHGVAVIAGRASGTGTFYLTVRDNSYNYTGAYSLTLTKVLGPQAPDPSGDEGQLTSGTTLNGAISPIGDVDRYTMEMTAGDNFYLVATTTNGASGFDPIIYVFGPNGGSVAYSTADSSGVAAIYAQAANSGTYYVTIRDNSYNHTGGYSLTLTKVLGPQAPDPSGDGGELTSGATLNGAISPVGDVDLYTLNAAAGEYLYLVATTTNRASGFDPIIEVFGPGGAEAAYSIADSSGVATIYRQNLNSGTHYVIVRDNSYNHTGGYSLTLTKVLGSQAPDPNGDEGELTSGAAVNGTISPIGDIDIYTMNLSAGDKYSLVVTNTSTASGFNPAIFLYTPGGGPDGSVAAGSSGTATLSGTAQNSGTYYLLIHDKSFDYTGSYSIQRTK